MATEQQCTEALQVLADRLAASDGTVRNRGFDRTLTCTIRDLGIIYSGRLQDGQLVNIGRADSDGAQIRLAMTSDDLLALVDGQLHMGSAWATGRVKVEAGLRDLLRLRSIF